MQLSVSFNWLMLLAKSARENLLWTNIQSPVILYSYVWSALSPRLVVCHPFGFASRHNPRCQSELCRCKQCEYAYYIHFVSEWRTVLQNFRAIGAFVVCFSSQKWWWQQRRFRCLTHMCLWRVSMHATIKSCTFGCRVSPRAFTYSPLLKLHLHRSRKDQRY